MQYFLLAIITFQHLPKALRIRYLLMYSYKIYYVFMQFILDFFKLKVSNISCNFYSLYFFTNLPQSPLFIFSLYSDSWLLLYGMSFYCYPWFCIITVKDNHLETSVLARFLFVKEKYYI